MLAVGRAGFHALAQLPVARGTALPARLSQRSTRSRREEAGRGACPPPANTLSAERCPRTLPAQCDVADGWARPETLKSNMTDAPSPASLANLLQQDLRLLASSAAEQRAWAAAQAVHVPPDEMRLSLLDEAPGLMYVYVENGYSDAEGEAALLALERLLRSGSRSFHGEIAPLIADVASLADCVDYPSLTDPLGPITTLPECGTVRFLVGPRSSSQAVADCRPDRVLRLITKLPRVLRRTDTDGHQEQRSMTGLVTNDSVRPGGEG